MKLTREQAAKLDRLLRIRLQYVRRVLDRYIELRPEPRDAVLRSLTDAANALQAVCGHLNSIASGTTIDR